MPPRSFRCICWIGAALLALGPRVVQAQQPATTTVVTPSFDFSGVIFGSFNVRTDSASRASLGGKDPNQFQVDRAYLNFRMPAGQNGAIRVTTDIFQNTNTAQNAYYQGWVIRLKYAWLQYSGLTNQMGSGSSLLGRIGLLTTVAIDHEEQFWLRYLQQTALEKNGFFSSADMGLAGLMTLPNHYGEVYAVITNGPGYTAVERDRFKDYQLRVSITPLGGQTINPIIRSWVISPWGYLGQVGSAFQAGGAGQIGPGQNGAITDGLTRSRYGIFTAVRDPRLTAGLEYAVRKDQSETGSNTVPAPRLLHDSTGTLGDGFVIVRPMNWVQARPTSPWAVIARFDHFTPNANPTSPNYAGTTPAQNFWILGTSWDLTARMTFALDYQQLMGVNYPTPTGTNIRSPAEQQTIFLHFQALF